MKVLSNLFITLTAIIHALFFKIESIDFMKPEVLEKFGLNETTGETVRIWAFNQGFYNLFFTFGLLYSLYLINFKDKNGGVLLARFILISIVCAGGVLYISVPHKILGACIQAFPALLALATLRTSK